MGPSVGLLLEGIANSPEEITSFDGPSPPPPPPPPPSAVEAPFATQLTLGRRKALLKQLLLGLNCLHSNAVAHGDLNPGNFLLAIRQFSSQDVQNIRTSCENSGKSAPVRRIDGAQDLWAPRYLYLDRPLVDFVDMEHKVSAKLSDLGAGKYGEVQAQYSRSRLQVNTLTAFTFDNPPTADKCVTPGALRAPEIVLNNEIDHKVDIWSFGCLFYEFLTGNVLFQVSGLTDIPQEENDDDHLLQMIDILGQPPPEIYAKWSRRTRYFDDNLQLMPL
jgi:non-specific serine/threonine protein kinase